MSGPVSFSSDAEAAVARRLSPLTIVHVPTSGDTQQIQAFFELTRCTEWINQGQFQRVCLQFPDNLLTAAAQVSFLLEKSTGKRMHILADTTYGSCCVDEKTAKHVNGDALIHFGPSCLSATTRIPVLYIFTKPFIPTNDISQAFMDNFTPMEEVVIVYDVVYETVARSVAETLSVTHPRAQLSELVIPGFKAAEEEDEDDWIVKYGRRLPSNIIEIGNVFYIGNSSGRTLLNLMLSLPSVKFHIYDPSVKILEEKTVQLSKLLMKRNYYIEKVKDAKSVGILIGTLAVEQYLNMIEQIKETLRRAGKSYYTVSIGDITPPKLANFPDIEVFVLVACPECSVVESKEFFQPIITPFELELAFNKAREWTGDYIIDYRVLLPGGASHVSLETDTECPDVSLITGAMRVLPNWQGLDVTEERRQLIFEGRSGIAQHYVDEPIDN